MISRDLEGMVKAICWKFHHDFIRNWDQDGFHKKLLPGTLEEMGKYLLLGIAARSIS
jgi:hypothetical protein